MLQDTGSEDFVIGNLALAAFVPLSPIAPHLLLHTARLVCHPPCPPLPHSTPPATQHRAPDRTYTKLLPCPLLPHSTPSAAQHLLPGRRDLRQAFRPSRRSCPQPRHPRREAGGPAAAPPLPARGTHALGCGGVGGRFRVRVQAWPSAEMERGWGGWHGGQVRGDGLHFCGWAGTWGEAVGDQAHHMHSRGTRVCVWGVCLTLDRERLLHTETMSFLIKGTSTPRFTVNSRSLCDWDRT